jgi:actin-related protein 10
MLPGFIPRLHEELRRILTRPPSSPPSATPRRGRSAYDRYESLRPLAAHVAILNNPTPSPPMSTRSVQNAGKAPAFTAACMAWVGGSLAGYVRPFALITSLCTSTLATAEADRCDVLF